MATMVVAALVIHIWVSGGRRFGLESKLTAKEMQSLRPRERGRYVQNLILGSLDESKPYSLSEIVDRTGLARPTVSRHLDALASTQQVKRAEQRLGRMTVSFYTRMGRVSRREELSRTSGESSYSLFVLEDGDEQSVCIQQKGGDEYGAPVVRGAVTVRFDDLQSFIRELHAYGARVIDK